MYGRLILYWICGLKLENWYYTWNSSYSPPPPPVAIFERFQNKVYDYRPVHEAIDDRQPVGLSNLRVWKDLTSR